MLLLGNFLLNFVSTDSSSILRILQIILSIIVAIGGIGLIAVQVNVLPFSLRTLREKQSQGVHITWFNYSTTLYSLGFLCFGVAMLLFSIGILIGQVNSTTSIIGVSLTLIGLVLLGFMLFFVLRARMITSKENKQQRRM